MSGRARFAFWLLAALAFGQIFWWGYLIVSQQAMIAKLLGTDEALVKTSNYTWMIAAEGAFFLAVWFFGVFAVLRSFHRRIEAQKNQQDFLSAVTHELKTPIASVRLCLDTLEREGLTHTERQTYLARAQGCLDRLLGEIEGLLVIAQGDRSPDVPNEQSELFPLLQEILSQHSKSKSVTIPPNVQSAVMPGSKPLVRLVLKAVIENAVRYQKDPATAQISIDFGSQGESNQLLISDNGIGLTPKEKEDLFIPFRRGDVASQLHSGSGVGLSIARKLAARVGVLLEVNSPGRDKGTQVKLSWRKPK